MKTLKIVSFAAILSAIVATGAWADDFTVGAIKIERPQVRAMLPGADVGGGYLRITNAGTENDKLVTVTARRAESVELHRMSVDNGIMVMREIKDGIPIPAGETVKFDPGGYHLMFMHVTQPFKRGERISATVTFEKAGSLDIDFAVGSAAGPLDAADTSMDHAGMQAAGMDMGKMQPDAPTSITTTLKTLFERVDKPLTVEPVVVVADWAIAGWTQDGRGGRALMRKSHHGWEIYLCSGDSLKQADALSEIGLSPEVSKELSQKLAAAEQGLGADNLALFSSFEGTVMMHGKDDVPGQGDHAGHGK